MTFSQVIQLLVFILAIIMAGECLRQLIMIVASPKYIKAPDYKPPKDPLELMNMPEDDLCGIKRYPLDDHIRPFLASLFALLLAAHYMQNVIGWPLWIFD